MKSHYPETNDLIKRVENGKYPVDAVARIIYAVAANSNLSVSEVLEIANWALDNREA